MIDFLLDLIAPVKCVFCASPKTLLCESHILEPAAHEEKLDGITGFYATELDPAMLAALSAFKDRSMTALAPVFAKLIEPLVDSDSWQGATRVAVPPSSPRAYRSRGFVPVKQILRHSKSSLPVVSLGLARKVKDQRELDARTRQLNLRGAFRAPLLTGEKVVLFDDVLTTSATIQEMRRAIEVAGGEVTGFCVLARRFVHSTQELEIKA